MADGLSDLAVLLLGRAGRVERVIGSALATSGLGVPHWRVLTHLQDCPDGATMADLLALSGLPGGTLTRTVDRLVDLALVHRTLDGQDRRKVLARLTERGAGRHRELLPVVEEAIADELEALLGWEREALRGLLAKEQSEG